MDKGKIIAFDTPTGLKQKYGKGPKTIELTFNDIPNKLLIDHLRILSITDKVVKIEIILIHLLGSMEHIQLRLQLIM